MSVAAVQSQARIRYRSRCLFVIWVTRRSREPGVVKAYIAQEGFEQFFGISELVLTAAVGKVDEFILLDQAAAKELVAGLRQVLTMEDRFDEPAGRR